MGSELTQRSVCSFQCKSILRAGANAVAMEQRQGAIDSSPDYRKATCTVETVNLSTSHLSNSVMYRLTLILTVVMTACNH